MSTTMSRVTLAKLNALFQAATSGVSIATAPTGAITAPANGDLIPISSGNGTVLIFITSGTGSTITIKNVIPPPYGTGGDVTVTCAATDIQAVYIENDGVGRFDQGGGSAGLVQLQYSSTAALKVYAVTIP